MDVLLLRLEGPLQSWGDSAQWSVRDSRLEPTKSGVIGLLACCLGWGADHDEQIAALARDLRMGVRVDRAGSVLRDYHTVVGGVMSAEGKIKINAASRQPETVESWRDYLVDACFLVALEGGAARLDAVEAALRRPVWPPFLGRRSCPPSVPVYPAHADTPSRVRDARIEDAIAALPWLCEGRGDLPERPRAVMEVGPAGTPMGAVVQRRRDVPLSFVGRRFAHRYVYETPVIFVRKEG